jgi:hypothetical protein
MSSYQTLDETNEPEAWGIISRHFTRTWKASYPARMFCPDIDCTIEDETLPAPRILWIVRICNKKFNEYRAHHSGLRLNNEQRYWHGVTLTCSARYPTLRQEGRRPATYSPCADPACTACRITSDAGFENRKNWGRLGFGHYLSVHSSKSHIYSRSVYSPQSVFAMLCVTSSLGRVFTVDAVHGKSPGRWVRPPTGYDSVLQDFQPTVSPEFEPSPADDPSIVLYDTRALYPQYLIIYGF